MAGAVCGHIVRMSPPKGNRLHRLVTQGIHFYRIGKHCQNKNKPLPAGRGLLLFSYASTMPRTGRIPTFCLKTKTIATKTTSGCRAASTEALLTFVSLTALNQLK